MSKEAVEAAIREHAPDWWSVSEVAHVVGTVFDPGPFVADRGDVAHDMWAMGAGPEHEGCKYGGPDPADGDYENNCETCRVWLLDAADKILAARDAAFVIAEKVATTPGGSHDAARIADALVLDTWKAPYADLTEAEKAARAWQERGSIHGFEVKVSRSQRARRPNEG